MATDENGFRGRLKDFVVAHGEGWNHHEWLAFLTDLTDSGFDTSDPDRIGAALERERVSALLREAPVKGFGPKRRDAVADRFATVWSLRHASVDDLAEVPGVPRGLAEALHAALR
jgi:Helix-hairpin-helix domain